MIKIKREAYNLIKKIVSKIYEIWNIVTDLCVKKNLFTIASMRTTWHDFMRLSYND